MATARVNIPQNKEKEDQYSFETLKDQLKSKWSNRRKPTQADQKSAQMFPKILMALQCPSQLYLFLFYIIPRLFEGFDEMIIFLQLVVCFCCAEGLMNYFCTLFSDSSVKSSDKWQLKHLGEKSFTNGHVSNEARTSRDDGGMPWKFCEKCNIHTPPRSHHCKVCEQCILKRDHHCFMVGNCIGFYNQRYFFVLGFYAVICGIGGFICTAYYLYLFYWPTAVSWTSLFPPVIFFRWLFGYEEVELHIVILIFQAYPELFFGMFGIIVVNAQILMAVNGKTPYEITEKLPIKSTNTVAENLESVFGKFWMMNFFFPTTYFIKQPGDGYQWNDIKMEHNNNDKDHVIIDI